MGVVENYCAAWYDGIGNVIFNQELVVSHQKFCRNAVLSTDLSYPINANRYCDALKNWFEEWYWLSRFCLLFDFMCIIFVRFCLHTSKILQVQKICLKCSWTNIWASQRILLTLENNSMISQFKQYICKSLAVLSTVACVT